MDISELDTLYAARVLAFDKGKAEASIQPLCIDVYGNTVKSQEEQEYAQLDGVLCASWKVGSFHIPPEYQKGDIVLVGVMKTAPEVAREGNLGVTTVEPFNLGNSIVLCSFAATSPKATAGSIELYQKDGDTEKLAASMSADKMVLTFGLTTITFNEKGIEIANTDTAKPSTAATSPIDIKFTYGDGMSAKLIDWLNAHIHETAVGPSTSPLSVKFPVAALATSDAQKEADKKLKQQLDALPDP